MPSDRPLSNATPNVAAASPVGAGRFALRLASASPRRRELLAVLGLPLRIASATVDERAQPDEPAEALVRRLALAKARAAAHDSAPGEVVIGADTVVELDGRLLGKPADHAEAAAMLTALAGRSHRVFSALALLDPARGHAHLELCQTEVPMRAYDPAEVAAYVATGSPLDKAGAYGIQDRDFEPVAVGRLHGCFANVMGLPLCHLTRALRALGQDPPLDVALACQTALDIDCPVHAEILDGRA